MLYTPGRVSIVMPVYNGATWLPESIRSVMVQDYPDIELVVADDGSTDGSAEVAEQLGAHKVLRLSRLANTAVVRNAAIKASSGQFITFLDADDHYLQGRIRKGLEHLTRHPEAAMSVCGIHLIDVRGEFLGPYIFPLVDGEGEVKDFLAAQLDLNWVPYCGVTVKRSAIEAVGLFDKQMVRYSDDYELWNRIGYRFKIVWLPEVLAEVRKHEAGITAGEGAIRQAKHDFIVTKRILRMRPGLLPRTPRRFGCIHERLAFIYLELGHRSKAVFHAFAGLLWCPWKPRYYKLILQIAYRFWMPLWVKAAWRRMKRGTGLDN
ncbi:MAG: glycosyltransferase family 2 protein [Chloroflexi bacterium]|nr:glycosyltransferase family 2 protein [Chloroflexota bacterium]